jgi:cytochrome c oxidase assembly factor CtaG
VNSALVVTAAVAVLYGLGVRRVPAWSPGRALAFAAGLCLLAVGLSVPVDHAADGRLSWHMAQHMVIALGAAPLLVLGAPLRLALGAVAHGSARALSRLASGRLGLLTHPVVAGLLFAAAGLAMHVPAVYEAALASPWAHAGIHAIFLAAAILFWTPLLAPEPLSHRLSAMGKLVYILLAMPAMAIVGVALNTSGSPAYDHYADTARSLGVSAVADQQLAGALMWIAGGVGLGAAFVACGWRALAAEERRAVAREARTGGGA